MYKVDNQITISEFMSPFGKLDPNNRWVRMSELIPWRHFEKQYSGQFCADNGAPAILYRMAMGALIIKQQTEHSDEEVLQDILENPYMQFFIGLHEFTTKAPFSSSSMTNFRKYISYEMMKEVNEYMFGTAEDNDDVDGDNGESSSSGNQDDMGNDDNSQEESRNSGTLMLDATCAPANIAYPTDINLLNEAREKLEVMIDTLHPQSGRKLKPRTYRKAARKQYLEFVMQPKPGIEKVRKAIGQQLSYVSRNIKHIDELLSKVGNEVLSSNQQKWLKTIRTLYEQQVYMHENKTHSVQNRICSIDQPHVRPIVRGKSRAPVEFGAKVSISLINGYNFIDRLGWDAYNEESELIPAVEAYKKRYGCYPERVLADQLYRNTNNRKYCKKHGIRLSGPRLGRPPKESDVDALNQMARDSADRSAIEGKFGEGKNHYGLNRIMARLQETSETVIAIAFFCMNLKRKLRVLLRLFFSDYIFGFIELFLLKYGFLGKP